MAKLVKCKTCGAEIAKSAKTCPKCGAKQKKHTLLGVVLVIVGMILVIAAIGGNSDDGPQKVGNIGSSQLQSGQSSTNSKEQSEEQTVFGVGDQVSLNDVIVTLNAVTESSGSQFNKPTDGNTFILCEFTIENNSSNELNVSSMLCFDGYIDDYSASMSISAQLESDKGQLDGTVAPGKKMNGAIGYEASSDWEELEIHFTPNFWSGKEIIFTYQK